MIASWSRVKDDIQSIARACGRNPVDVQLIVVAKNQPLASIEKLVNAGQSHFAESYIQEAIPQIKALSHHEITWHFIGPIQSNKVKKIAEFFDWVHSIDRIEIAQKLNAACAKLDKKIHMLIQVNISHEDQKSGVDATEVLPLVEKLQVCSHLDFQGLMGIAAQSKDRESVQRSFAELVSVQQQLQARGIACPHLSMGMSQDYACAIRMGATWVRVGTAIFGGPSFR